MSVACMIDLETLDTSPYCVILTIGAVRFNPNGNGVTDRLALRPTIEDQTEKYNRTISEDTLAWWSKQSNEARSEALSDDNRQSFVECMEALYKFCWNSDSVWSHGASFDIVVCETAMRQTLTDRAQPVPWPFYRIRDTRTLYEIAGLSLYDSKYRNKVSHRALDDAEHQALLVQEAYKKLTQLRTDAIK